MIIDDEDQKREREELEKHIGALSGKIKYALNSPEGKIFLKELKRYLGIGRQYPRRELGHEMLARKAQAQDTWNYIQLLLEEETQ